MKYTNPEIPEGINVSKTHPLSEFALLSVGVFGALAIIIVVLSFFADKFAHYIPFEYEPQINVGYMLEQYPDAKLRQYLQNLADRIVVAEKLPQDMKIKVAVIDSETVNAFASLGGQVVFFTGLLKRIPNENALAMVMAHEIAHIKHRHPIRSVGRGVILGIIVAMFSASLGDSVVSASVGDVGLISQLKFSRSNEIEADQTALDALQRIYGHVDGAKDLFEILKSQEGKRQLPEFFSTHPDTEGRIRRIDAHTGAGSTGYNELKALPPHFLTWQGVQRLPASTLPNSPN